MTNSCEIENGVFAVAISRPHASISGCTVPVSSRGFSVGFNNANWILEHYPPAEAARQARLAVDEAGPRKRGRARARCGEAGAEAGPSRQVRVQGRVLIDVQSNRLFLFYGYVYNSLHPVQLYLRGEKHKTRTTPTGAERG